MKVELSAAPFNPWTYLQNHEKNLSIGQYGAVVNFIGTMRDFNEGDEVSAMFLEHYPGMTEKYLRQLSETAMQRWQIQDTLIIHRVGQILPGDTLVLTAAWAAHRAAAFAACRYLIEELKSNAPFWKQETLRSGEKRWVTHNTPA